MNVVIAGGRHYRLTKQDKAWLDALHAKWNFERVLSGACRGADMDAVQWVKDMPNGRRRPTIELYPANWYDFGKAAGPMRNAVMAKHADLVIVFPGGPGTASMVREAVKAGVRVLHAYPPVIEPEYVEPDEYDPYEPE